MLASCLILSGCNTPTASAQPTSMNASQTKEVLRKVPTLIVQNGCKACNVDPKIEKIISDAYANAATKLSFSIDREKTATLTITDYSSRGITKFLLGPLAITMTDEIKAEVVSGDRKFRLEENARVIFRNIDSVAKVIGQMALDEISAP
jgi:hypothetical protein